MNDKYKALFLILVIVGAVAILATWFSNASLRDWYPTLAKPSWTPPAGVFGPIWIVLYLMMALAMWLVWQKKPAENAYFWFGIQLALNLLWSFLFFYLQLPFIALVAVCSLWWALLMTMIVFWNYSRLASILLGPYLAWVSFAITLNLGVLTTQSFLRTVNQF